MITTSSIDFKKSGGLIPAIIQDAATKRVLMLGYMNEESFIQTVESKRVTFYSRSKKRLWTKGEESKNYLYVVDMKLDCDKDSLLIQVNPAGPVCHLGTDTCWGENNKRDNLDFLRQLSIVIQNRKNNPSDKSYTSSLFKKGINKIAQKVGEEAVEIVIEAKDDNRELFLGEAADLIFHLLVLLEAKGESLDNVIEVLENRHQ